MFLENKYVLKVILIISQASETVFQGGLWKQPYGFKIKQSMKNLKLPFLTKKKK